MKSNQSWKVVYEDKMIDVEMKEHIILSTELEKIRLRLENKLRLFFNEWFIHENEGMNWVKRVNNNGQIGNLLERFNIETQIKETIISDEDVEEILNFKSDFQYSTGNYNFEVTILLKSGEKLVI